MDKKEELIKSLTDDAEVISKHLRQYRRDTHANGAYQNAPFHEEYMQLLKNLHRNYTLISTLQGPSYKNYEHVDYLSIDTDEEIYPEDIEFAVDYANKHYVQYGTELAVCDMYDLTDCEGCCDE